MIFYGGQNDKNGHVDLTIGKDAAYYHPDAVHIHWNSDGQPFGYQGICQLAQEINRALKYER